jgi:hypothetical protein
MKAASLFFDLTNIALRRALETATRLEALEAVARCDCSQGKNKMPALIAVDGSSVMDIADALQIVLDLASRNIDPDENIAAKQIEAINIVTDMAVNQFGDD